jgi:ABC-type glutathione transport system ATPase component
VSDAGLSDTGVHDTSMNSTGTDAPQAGHAINVTSLVREYHLGRGRILRAVDDVSFQVEQGETFGIVGESGSGKTTLARMLLRLVRPTSGSISVLGVDPWHARRSEHATYHRLVQVVFQDPYSSMNPKMRIGSIVAEGVRRAPHPAGIEAEVGRLLELVGLPTRYAELHPHQLSGGQRQRVAIARALAVQPKILVADEPVSALDVSMRGQILNLLMDLQRELGLTVVFISHDLGVVRQMCQRIIVMHRGRIVEQGDPSVIFTSPQQEYTRILVASTPVVPVAP